MMNIETSVGLEDSKKWALENIANWLNIYQLSEEVFTQLGHSDWKEKIGNCTSWEEVYQQFDYYTDLLKSEGKKKQISNLEEYWKEACIKNIEYYLDLYKVPEEKFNKKLGTDDWRKVIRGLSNENQVKEKQVAFISKIVKSDAKEELDQKESAKNRESSQSRSYNYPKNLNQGDNSAAILGGLLLLGGIVLLIIYLVRKNRRG